MSYLPAPYESAQQDDLPAAIGAGLSVTVAGITSWILGHRAYQGIRALVDDGRAKRPLPKELLVPTAGWAIAALLMTCGALLLLLRKGRGALVFGALLSIGTTAIARYSFHLGSSTVPQWALYWGGVVVLGLAILPATGRWISTPNRAAAPFPTSAGYRPPG